MVGDGDGNLREQPLGLAHVGLVRIVVHVLIEVGETADGGAQRVERRRPLGQGREQIAKRRRQSPRRRHAILECLQLRHGGQLAVQQQVGDLVEACNARPTRRRSSRDS